MLLDSDVASTYLALRRILWMTFTACVAHETRANASLNLQISNDGYWRWAREFVSLYTSVAHNSDCR